MMNVKPKKMPKAATLIAIVEFKVQAIVAHSCVALTMKKINEPAKKRTPRIQLTTAAGVMTERVGREGALKAWSFMSQIIGLDDVWQPAVGYT